MRGGSELCWGLGDQEGTELSWDDGMSYEDGGIGVYRVCWVSESVLMVWLTAVCLVLWIFGAWWHSPPMAFEPRWAKGKHYHWSWRHWDGYLHTPGRIVFSPYVETRYVVRRTGS